MLVRTVILPSVFTSIPENQPSLYRIVINLLLTLEEKNGLILVDDHESIQKFLIAGIGKWPQKYRKEAQVVLKRLNSKNRFVKVSIKSESQLTCDKKPCYHCIKIALDYCPTAVITRQECYLCATQHLALVNTVKVVDIVEDSISNLFPSDYVLKKGEWNQQEFEQNILVPLLRDAKNVKIFDRYIGRSILKPNAAKYKLTLEWIFDVFLQERGSKFKGVFEVYGGVGIDISKKEIPIAVDQLRNLETELQKKHPDFTLIIKKETQKSQMHHDRFLITDQVAVSFGRGFNLLDGSSPKLVQDISIAYCSEPGKIEQAVRTLQDL
jgi:hypothetical protein